MIPLYPAADAQFQAPPGCALENATIRLEQVGDVVRETATVSIRSEGHCGEAIFGLPADVRWVSGAAKLRLSDDTKRKLPPSRFVIERAAVTSDLPRPSVAEVAAADLRGDRFVRVIVPEMRTKDVLNVVIVREWPLAAGWTWSPSAERFAHASITAVAPLKLADGSQTAVFTPSAEPQAAWMLANSLPREAAPVLADFPPVDVARTLSIEIPKGDVQTRLYPGGGSTLTTTDVLTFPATATIRPHAMLLPVGAHDVTVSVDPPNAATWKVRDDAVVLQIAAGSTPTVATVRYAQLDTPACGEIKARPGENLTWDVIDSAGTVRTEGDFWSLTSHSGTTVMPDHDSVVRALGWRFDRVALPEPALPLELKGAPPSDELLTALRPVLYRRVRVAELPGDPLFPRGLYKARRSEVLTPVEAALVMRLYALQARFSTDWALVRPAEAGPGDDVCPIGHDQALIVVHGVSEDRWIDPGCASCGPYEIRPQLLGGSLFSRIGTEAPPLTPSKVTLNAAAGLLDVRLEGADALLLRIALDDVPFDDRPAWLAAHYGGAGAELVSVDGITEAGAPVVAQIRPKGVVADLLLAHPSGTDWWTDTLGERSYERDVDANGLELFTATSDSGAFAYWADRRAAHSVDFPAIRYERTVAAGRIREVVTVRDRRIPNEAYQAITRAVLGEAPVPPAKPVLAPIPAVTLAPIGENNAIRAVTVARVALDGQATTTDAQTLARNTLTALPFRARIDSKTVSTTLYERPNAAPVRRRVASSSEAVFVDAITAGWAHIDVEGPLSDTRIDGWVPLESLIPVVPEEPLVRGDLPLDRWTPISGEPNQGRLERDISLRGFTVPAGFAVRWDDAGLLDGLIAPTTQVVGGLSVPSGQVIELPSECSARIGATCYTADADGKLIAP